MTNPTEVVVVVVIGREGNKVPIVIMFSESFLKIEEKLASDLMATLDFTADCKITHVYNPIQYAFETHSLYIYKYITKPVTALLLGMNPGPWGMAQTGVPFGEVTMTQNWLEISGNISVPVHQHPKRPILGFKCPRSEISGKRFWSFFQERFGSPDSFARKFAVYNYCPLSFMSKSGKNVTPSQLSRITRDRLYALCDEALLEIVRLLSVQHIIGVGRFAEQRAIRALKMDPDLRNIKVSTILHPSPANPLANKEWSSVVFRQLSDLDLLPSA